MCLIINLTFSFKAVDPGDHGELDDDMDDYHDHHTMEVQPDIIHDDIAEEDDDDIEDEGPNNHHHEIIENEEVDPIATN